MTLEQHRLHVELERFDWARELDKETIQDIAATAELIEFQPGEAVFELDSDLKRVYFVISGRLEGSLFDRLGKEIHRDTFRRGSVVGLFSVLLPGRSNLHVEAAEHTTVIHLTLDDLLRLTTKHREFQLTMFRIGANIVKRLVIVDRELPKPAVIAVVHHSDASRSLVAELARRLQQLGELPCVAGDRENGKLGPEIPQRLLFEDGVFVGHDRIRSLLTEWTSYGRLFIDIRAEHSAENLQRILGYADLVLWCVQPQDVAAALEVLKTVQRLVPKLRDKLCIVWFLDSDWPAPPYIAELVECAVRDFKIHSGEPNPNRSKMLGQGVQRIIHYLRGVQIGLALGGGAARGMAHLGVIKALEQHGIFVDMIAGTSAGAMVGGVYAAGFDPEFCTNSFKNDLLPPWLFRQLPAGGYWYLLYKYRFGQFGPMLRKYLDNLRSEQLVIPIMMISADLADGVTLVRDRGDATHNILESINLPPLSLPIIQAGQAVVDGGLLNNVPANVLVAKGCNFVIASTVTAELEKDFMGIRSKKSLRMGQISTTIQVMMRQLMILNYNMNAVGVEPADVVITPDVTSFDMAAFTRADEMADIGAEAADSSVHQIKQMLSKLDPQLFG